MLLVVLIIWGAQLLKKGDEVGELPKDKSPLLRSYFDWPIINLF